MSSVIYSTPHVEQCSGLNVKCFIVSSHLCYFLWHNKIFIQQFILVWAILWVAILNRRDGKISLPCPRCVCVYIYIYIYLHTHTHTILLIFLWISFYDPPKFSSLFVLLLLHLPLVISHSHQCHPTPLGMTKCFCLAPTCSTLLPSLIVRDDAILSQLICRGLNYRLKM